MVQTRQKHAFTDHSDLVARRMGFIPLPLGVVMIRVLVHSVHINDLPSFVIFLLACLCLASFRILNSILILGKACDLITQHKQEKASIQSPVMNRTMSPVMTNSKGTMGKDWLKDMATSPLKPVVSHCICLL